MSEITNATEQSVSVKNKPKNIVTDEAMNLMKSYKIGKKKASNSKTKSKTSATDKDAKSKDRKQRYMFIIGDYIYYTYGYVCTSR